VGNAIFDFSWKGINGSTIAREQEANRNFPWQWRCLIHVGPQLARRQFQHLLRSVDNPQQLPDSNREIFLDAVYQSVVISNNIKRLNIIRANKKKDSSRILFLWSALLRSSCLPDDISRSGHRRQDAAADDRAGFNKHKLTAIMLRGLLTWHTKHVAIVKVP